VNSGVEEAAWSYRDRLVACARKVLGDEHEAEDVAQEVLLRKESGRARDAVSLPAWLFAVCYRLAVDRRRARARRERAHATRGAHESEGTQDAALERDESERLRRLVRELAEPYRSAVELRYLEQRSFEEVARRLGTIERTARTWVARGLERLREPASGSERGARGESPGTRR
jgi:RNA polymerase sigma-70 factor (ECF subfamily)